MIHIIFSCNSTSSLENRLDSFYDALVEVGEYNQDKEKDYLIDLFKSGDFAGISRDINFYCYKIGLDQTKEDASIPTDDWSPKKACPKLLEVKEKESIQLWSTFDTASFFHVYFYQKLQQKENP